MNFNTYKRKNISWVKCVLFSYQNLVCKQYDGFFKVDLFEGGFKNVLVLQFFVVFPL